MYIIYIYIYIYIQPISDPNPTSRVLLCGAPRIIQPIFEPNLGAPRIIQPIFEPNLGAPQQVYRNRLKSMVLRGKTILWDTAPDLPDLPDLAETM